MKRALTDLAFFGGPATFPSALHVGRPNIGDRSTLRRRLDAMLDRRCLANDGPLVEEFEHRVAAIAGVRHCVSMCSGTVALQIAARALGMSGEVIVPSFTFIATAHALFWQGITPVFCDIDPHTFNIDPSQVEALITPRTTGIIGVHIWGRGCDVEALTEIARRHRLHLVFDAAHAFSCSVGGHPIGSFGDAEVFSFHATKFLNAFEGGALVTNDHALADRARLMKNFGFAGEDSVVLVGTNGKMNEASAAMGLTSLDSIDYFIAVNRRNYEKYAQELAGLPGISLLPYAAAERSNYQYIVIEVDQAQCGIDRDLLKELLRAENVLARRYFYPGCHRMEPYRTIFPDAGQRLPHTERQTTRVLSLPTGTAVGPDEIERLCTLIRFVVDHAREIVSRVGVNVVQSSCIIGCVLDSLVAAGG